MMSNRSAAHTLGLKSEIKSTRLEAVRRLVELGLKATKQATARRSHRHGLAPRCTKSEKYTREVKQPGWWRWIFRAVPKDRYETAVESWRHLQSDNYEFTMKRLR